MCKGHHRTRCPMINALALGLTCFLVAQSQEIRIDTFDTRSNRTGYIVVNPNTGRLDQFDTRGNRQGYGTTTTTPYGTRIDTFTPDGARTGSGTLSTTQRR